MRIAATSVGACFRCSRNKASASGMRFSTSASAAASRRGSRVEYCQSRAARPPRLFAGRRQMVAQRAPGFRQIGLQFDRLLQLRHSGLAVAELAQRDAELVACRRPAGLLYDQGCKGCEGAVTIPAGALGDAEDESRIRLARKCPEDLGGLLGRQPRVALQQTRSMSERHVDRTDRCCHATPRIHVTKSSTTKQ